MARVTAGALAAAAALLALPAAATAATVTISIGASGFSPSIVTIDHGDGVTWHNGDKTNHQVVADDGSFASPILRPGQSWTATLTTAGTFRYHDALHPLLVGKITVKGPPPSVTLALSAPIVPYGTQVTLSGAISTGAVGDSVEIDAQPWGQPSPVELAVVKTGTGGTFGYVVTPSLYTTYVARWKGVASGTVVVQVAPKLRLLSGGSDWMLASVSSPVSLWHRHVFLQRLSPFGQWVNLVALNLGPQNGRLFHPRTYLPKGISQIRVFLSVNQAGAGLLAAQSGSETVVRR